MPLREKQPSPPDRIEVNVRTLSQLFNSMDPSPFRDRDLDPDVEDFIVEWCREIAPSRPLSLVVHLRDEQVPAEHATALREAVGDHFRGRATAERRRLRKLLRIGRISLLIGIVVLGTAIILGDLLEGLVGKYDYGEIVAHSLLIGGWVALWRPIEIFLYDWWPIRAEARLYDRLSAMPVDFVGADAPPPA